MPAPEHWQAQPQQRQRRSLTSLRSFGYNYYHQLGLGPAAPNFVRSPTALPSLPQLAEGESVAVVDAGLHFSLALTDLGTLYACLSSPFSSCAAPQRADTVQWKLHMRCNFSRTSYASVK